MPNATMKRKIYEYQDYREYLRDYYEFKKETCNGFSLRSFSNHIGFKTKDFIWRVMQGSRNLSAASVARVIQAMHLESHEADFFAALVGFNQSKRTEERDGYFARMQQIIQTARFQNGQHLLAHYQYEVYSHWHHLAIRSLIGLYGFTGDYEALAAQLHPRIHKEEARKSVLLLEKCGLLKAKGKKGYEISHSAITTGDRTSKVALRGFHQRCLQLAAESIDRDSPQDRNISGLTLGISRTAYERIVERLNEFRKEIVLIAEEDKDADRVVQINFQVFPLSKPKAKAAQKSLKK